VRGDGSETRCMAGVVRVLGTDWLRRGLGIDWQGTAGARQSGALYSKAWNMKRKDLMGNAVMSLATGNARGSKGLCYAKVRTGCDVQWDARQQLRSDAMWSARIGLG